MRVSRFDPLFPWESQGAPGFFRRTGRRNKHAADRLTVPWKLIARVDVPSNFNLDPKKTYNVGPPSDVCWFINPINYSYLRIINHSYWSYLHQLSYRTGAQKTLGDTQRSGNLSVKAINHQFFEVPLGQFGSYAGLIQIT